MTESKQENNSPVSPHISSTCAVRHIRDCITCILCIALWSKYFLNQNKVFSLCITSDGLRRNILYTDYTFAENHSYTQDSVSKSTGLLSPMSDIFCSSSAYLLQFLLRIPFIIVKLLS